MLRRHPILLQLPTEIALTQKARLMINTFRDMNVSLKILKTLLVLLLISSPLASYSNVTLTDAESGQPLAKASIFDKNGVFIAISEEDGQIPINIPSSSYPLNVRYIGYEPVTISNHDMGTITMVESTYSLPEVVVDIASRNILYLQVYVREYTTLENAKDTLAIFKEQIVDYAIPVGKAKFKGWKKPRVLAQKEYEYVKIDKKKNSIDTLLYSDGGKFRSTNFNIAQNFKMPQNIISGESTEHIKQGKYYPEERWTVIKDGYIYETDGLANSKDHYFQPGFLKLFGMTVAQTLDENKYKFEKGSKPGANVENLIEASQNFDMIIKGKLFKKATEQNEDTKMAFFSEMFVIDRVYLTAEEAKELKKDAPVVDLAHFKIPDGIPAPPEEVAKLKAAVLESAGR